MNQYRMGRIMKWMFRVRFPSRLYDWHLGWLLGSRICRLTHVGRKSGKRHHTVLEVVNADTATGEVMVISGTGPKAQWYLNLRANGDAEIETGRRRFAARYRELPIEEAAQVLAGYERRNRIIAPIVRHLLSKLVGWRFDSSDAARRRLVSQLPMVAFAPENARSAGVT